MRRPRRSYERHSRATARARPRAARPALSAPRHSARRAGCRPPRTRARWSRCRSSPPSTACPDRKAVTCGCGSTGVLPARPYGSGPHGVGSQGGRTMRALRWVLVSVVVLGLGLAFNPSPGWAVGCCKCAGCSPPPAVQCTDSAPGLGGCDDFCESCSGSHTFDEAGTCGVGVFADCIAVQGLQAPALGSRGIGLTAAALFAAGVVLLARRARRA